MPSTFAVKHAAFLEKYFETGKEELLSNEKQLYAVHKDGHCFFIKLIVKQIPNLEGGIQYAGMIRETVEKYDCIITNEKGVIDTFTKNVEDFIGQPASIFKENEVNVKVFAPELADLYTAQSSVKGTSNTSKFTVPGGHPSFLYFPSNFTSGIALSGTAIRKASNNNAGNSLKPPLESRVTDQPKSRNKNVPLPEIKLKPNLSSPETGNFGEKRADSKIGELRRLQNQPLTNADQKKLVRFEVQELAYSLEPHKKRPYTIKVVKIVGLKSAEEVIKRSRDECSTPRSNNNLCTLPNGLGDSSSDLNVDSQNHLSPSMKKRILSHLLNDPIQEAINSGQSSGSNNLHFGRMNEESKYTATFLQKESSKAEEAPILSPKRANTGIKGSIIEENSNSDQPLANTTLFRQKSLFTINPTEGRNEIPIEKDGYPLSLKLTIKENEAKGVSIPSSINSTANIRPKGKSRRILPPGVEGDTFYRPSASELKVRNDLLKLEARKNRVKSSLPVKGESHVSNSEEDVDDSNEHRENEIRNENSGLLDDAESSETSRKARKLNNVHTSLRTAVDEKYVSRSLKNFGFAINFVSLFVLIFGGTFFYPLPINSIFLWSDFVTFFQAKNWHKRH
eukprot:TRINITY_DN861_c0_g1_i1.p1 TRINITY_DN861_c0_g1~~TRINITY_DN861_c0_g1_i1.p1  ORF type:complete len:621 (+),score=62.10 TRINITY_DN861_c0_g1_i1:5171-7033(+)